ncbi:MAG: RNA methyltransferase [Coxiellaceae bacterium]|nr:RNA methyltransferase [Coxiellaceae bacterium]
MLDRTRIILVEPSHPGNIGATARAMKNMELSSLYLVSPERFPHQEATVRAAGADEILAGATVVSSLAEAIGDCHLVFGTSARSRSLPWPNCTPREAAGLAVQSNEQSVAVVFGRESSGLTNEELALCHYHVHIPTSESFSSLNLAAAVQVIVYEFFMASQATALIFNDLDDMPATAGQIAGFLEQFESLLTDIQFLDPKHPKLLMQRLQRLFNRARLEEKEIHILRGILSTLEKRLLVS